MNTRLSADDLPCGIWLALDQGVDEWDTVYSLAHQTQGLVTGLKVHASIEDAAKTKIGQLRSIGARVWWDRKIDDTPNTAAEVARTVLSCGANRVTVMTSAGIEAMMSVLEHGPEEVIAVTDLTSLDAAEIGMSRGMSPKASVLQKAQWAKLAGITSLVCSVAELPLLDSRRWTSKFANRKLELYGMSFTTPGTRTISTDTSGQARVGTAVAAIMDGADELVVGREVTEAEDPMVALQKLYKMILDGLEND